MCLALALLFDKYLGEPRHFHPLVGFGRYASSLERLLNGQPDAGKIRGWVMGMVALAVAVIPCVLIFVLVQYLVNRFTGGAFLPGVIFSAFVLYLAIGWQSLLQHARAIFAPLAAGDSPAARAAVAMVVSRDCEQLDDSGIARVATESILENGADAIFAAIFWFPD